MLTSIGGFQDYLDKIRAEAIDVFVTKALFRQAIPKAEARTHDFGEFRVSQQMITAEWQHLPESTKVLAPDHGNIGSLEALRKLIFETQQWAKGGLTTGPTAAITRTYQVYLDQAGGPASIAAWKKSGFAKKDGPDGGPSQPVPEAWTVGGKDTSALVHMYDLDDSTDRKLMDTFLKNAKREEYGPVSESANPDLFKVMKARGGLDNGSSPFQYANYMWARACATKESFEDWVKTTLKLHTGYTLITSPVKALSEIRGNPSQADDWLTITISCSSIASLVESFLLLRRDCAGHTTGAHKAAVERTPEDGSDEVHSDTFNDLVSVKQNIDKAKHEVLMLVNFEGMLCKVELQLEKVLALKDIVKVPSTLANRNPEQSPAFEELLKLNNSMHAERITAADITLTATYL